MDFRDLKYFAVIAEEGHVGRAAERLFKTQPALTKCIDRLEEQLGAPLFERVGRGIRLTPVGEALLHRARRISLMMDETAREIGDYAHGREGNIRLGCIPTLAEHILPGICQQLLAEAEKVTIDLKVSMNDALLEGLKAGELDVVLGPMIHEFGWKPDEWDRLAAGIVAGHAIECGAQGSGGNCQDDWATIPDLADIGYPIVEANADGSFVVTKHAGTGGRVTVASVTEQLVYEIGDPRAYLTPDCGADFTSFHLAREGANRVRCTGVKGLPATPSYKVSISFAAGFRALGSVAYAWPDAYEKAKAGARILRERLDRMGLEFDAVHSELLGANACHGIAAAEPSPELAAQLPEVVMRFGVRSKNRAAVDRFTKEIAPLVLSGPPSVTGLGAGRPKVEEVMAYWPALIPKSEVSPVVSQ